MGRKKIVLSDEHYALLGQIYDSELASIAGVSAVTIQRIRRRLRIPRCSPSNNKDHCRRTLRKKYPGMYEMLGNKNDSLIADKYSISRERVRQYRAALEIEKPNSGILYRLDDDDSKFILNNLGKISDAELSRTVGISASAISKLRKKYNIPAHKSQEHKRRISAIASVIDRLGVDSDHSIAMDINVPTEFVRRRRIKLGIKPVPTRRWDYAGWKRQAG